MGDFKHLLVVKFKDGAAGVEEILKGMETMISEIDVVKSFEWGQDMEGNEMLTQGFTHAFLITFHKKDDLNVYLKHPKHVEFAVIFREAIEKFMLLDFPIVPLNKAPA